LHDSRSKRNHHATRQPSFRQLSDTFFAYENAKDGEQNCQYERKALTRAGLLTDYCRIMHSSCARPTTGRLYRGSAGTEEEGFGVSQRIQAPRRYQVYQYCSTKWKTRAQKKKQSENPDFR